MEPEGVEGEAPADSTSSFANAGSLLSNPASANDAFGPGTSTIISIHPPPPDVSKAYVSYDFKGPKNPHATLLGLPPELRQEVHDHLYPSRLTHVIFTRTNYSGTSGPHYVFQGCKAPDPSLPQLCSRPPFSGSFPDRQRCMQVEQADAYDLRLAETCVLLRAEILQRICHRMSIAAAEGFFKHYGNEWKNNIHHLTLTCEGNSASKYWDLDSAIRLVQPIELPNLESLSLQTRKFTSHERVRDLFLPDGVAKNNWLQEDFNRAVRSRIKEPVNGFARYHFNPSPRRALSPPPFIPIRMEWWYRVCPDQWSKKRNIKDHEMLKVRTTIPAGGFSDSELVQHWDMFSDMNKEEFHETEGWRGWHSYYGSDNMCKCCY